MRPPCRWPLCSLRAGSLSGEGCTKSVEPVLTDLPSHCSRPWSLPQGVQRGWTCPRWGSRPCCRRDGPGTPPQSGKMGHARSHTRGGHVGWEEGPGEGRDLPGGAPWAGGDRQPCTVHFRVRQAWGRLLGPGSQLRGAGGAPFTCQRQQMLSGRGCWTHWRPLGSRGPRYLRGAGAGGREGRAGLSVLLEERRPIVKWTLSQILSDTWEAGGEGRGPDPGG